MLTGSHCAVSGTVHLCAGIKIRLMHKLGQIYGEFENFGGEFRVGMVN